MTRRPLTGVGVLVTRPAHQSDELVQAIEAEGGSVHRFPVFDIVPRDTTAVVEEARAQPTPDIIIFVSANAVRHGLASIGESSATIVAIGPATSAALGDAGVGVDVCPSAGYTSEHLLATDALKDVGAKTITIVRGESGRELLAETLCHRGATVQYLSVYRTEPHRFSRGELDAVEQACADGRIDAVLIMSVLTLNRLIDSLPLACIARLTDARLVGPSERVIQTALERLPGAKAILSPGPSATEMVAALVASLEKDPDPGHE